MPHPPEIELESVPCPLGCPEGEDEVLVGRDRIHGLPGEYPVVRCRACGLLRTNPRPTLNTIGYYYPDDYGPYVETRVHSVDNPASSRGAWKRFLLPLFRWNTACVPSLVPGRLLEIGCASGSFLRRMAQQGWTVEGVEPSITAGQAARALGYNVFTGPFEAMPERESSYDLIVGWMVLEHLHDPVHSLRKMHRALKPGGHLVISVPNAGSLEFAVFKDRWYALHLPAHLYHFTPGTLEAMLNKSGWRIHRIFHQRVLSNIAASFAYILQDYRCMNRLSDVLLGVPNMTGISHFLFYPIAYLLSLFGQTGRMTVWARRQDD